jgi:hypothetical protein
LDKFKAGLTEFSSATAGCMIAATLHTCQDGIQKMYSSEGVMPRCSSLVPSV